MKKSLVLAMAMALGVTASAYAANPFSDVPAGHWAYDSISTLVDAGVVEGYPDGTFGGDKLMTRYEMAQIVAKAMAKGANVDRLAAEFADELDALGVRVAALEKKTDNVKITGYARYNYRNVDTDGSKSTQSRLRTRLWFTGQVNDDWTYTAMVQNDKQFHATGDKNGDGIDDGKNADENTTDFQRAYLSGKLGGLNIIAGRQPLYLGEGNIYDSRYSGITASYGKDVKLTARYGRPEDETWDPDYDEYWGVDLAAKFGGVNVGAAYDKFIDGSTAYDDNGIFSVRAGAKLGGDFGLNGIYLHSDADCVTNDDGYQFGLTYGGANKSKPGSFGLAVNYYNLGDGVVAAHTMNGSYPTAKADGGFKGLMYAGYVTLAKNMVAGIEYYDLETKETDTDIDTFWAHLIVTF